MDGKVDVVQKGDDMKPGAGTESMLDIEYITSVGSNIATEFWGFQEIVRITSRTSLLLSG